MERETVNVLDIDQVRSIIGEAVKERSDTVQQASAEVEQEKAGTLVGRAAEIEVAGLPLGNATMGGISALVINEVVDLVAERSGVAARIPYANAVVQFVSAFAIVRWGGKVVSQKVADIAAMFLVWDGVNEMFDIKGFIRGLIPGSNPGEFGVQALVGKTSAPPIDYYSGAFGR